MEGRDAAKDCREDSERWLESQGMQGERRRPGAFGKGSERIQGNDDKNLQGSERKEAR